MKHLIYEVETGRIDSLRNASGMSGAEIIANVFGDEAGSYASVPHKGDFPVGKKIDPGSGALIADPDYVPPPPPEPAV